MSHIVIHDMDAAWASSNPSALSAQPDAGYLVEGAGSTLLSAQPGALGAYIELTPGSALDLTGFEEIRFWIRADQEADGSPSRPFFLELSYTDAADAAGEEHRWLVPVNQRGTWEQRRIGIGSDRRSAIVGFRFRCTTNLAFRCRIDEILAVRDEVLSDAEAALVARLAGATLPGVTGIALSQAAAPGATAVVIPLNKGFHAGNRVLVQGGSAGDEEHAVTSVTHDAGAGTTTLGLASSDAVVGSLPAGSATVTILAPIIVEAPPSAPDAVSPAILVTLLDAREDLERAAAYLQRDSFRPRGARVACSVRPAAQPYRVDYQIAAVAPIRSQQLAVQEHVLGRISGVDSVGGAGAAGALRINGQPAPLIVLPPPELSGRAAGVLAPAYVRIWTRREIAPRAEITLAAEVTLGAGPIDMQEVEPGTGPDGADVEPVVVESDEETIIIEL